MNPNDPSFIYLAAGLTVYIGICAGMIAAKHNKNPALYGLLAVLSPFNLILLGVWAFGKFERREDTGGSE